MKVSNSDVNLIIKKNDILLKENRNLHFNVYTTKVLLFISIATNIYFFTKRKN